MVLILTRLWQRAAQTILVQGDLPTDHRARIFAPAAPSFDPIPEPEPIAPSLAAPDEGVFHHEVPPGEEDLIH